MKDLATSDFALYRFGRSQPTVAHLWDACQNPAWMLKLLGEGGFDDDSRMRHVMVMMARRIESLLTDPASREAINRADAFTRGEVPRDRLFNAFARAASAASTILPFEGHRARAANVARLVAYVHHTQEEQPRSLADVAAEIADEVPAILSLASQGGLLSRRNTGNGLALTITRSAIARDLREAFGNPFALDATLRLRATVKSQALRKWARRKKLVYELEPTEIVWHAQLKKGQTVQFAEEAGAPMVAASKLFRSVYKVFPNDGLPVPGTEDEEIVLA